MCRLARGLPHASRFWLLVLRTGVLDIFKIDLFFSPHRPRLVRLIYRHGDRPVNSTTYEAPVLREAPAEQ